VTGAGGAVGTARGAVGTARGAVGTARVRGVGLLTGFGEGVAALPDDARAAAAGREIVPIATPRVAGERFRRATRECVLGVAAVEAALRAARLTPDDIRGSRTALVYVTAGAYGASNLAFVRGSGSGALHFPYTAPSAVPAEVAIEFGCTGSYVILIGGATATLEGLWHASSLVSRGEAALALVVAVETFAECAELYARARRVLGAPLVEAAACAVLEPSASTGDADRPTVAWQAATAAGRFETMARQRAGETLACGPLVSLALATADSDRATSERGPVTVTGQWRGRRTALAWGGRNRPWGDRNRPWGQG
jgi:hypothetical protein